VSIALVLLAAYLLGSIPSGVWLARSVGIDPRQTGSGNIGATNVARAAGARLGIATLICDALKGAVAVALALLASGPAWLPAATAIAAILGHLFSCFLRFRGGKGVATALGSFLVLTPLATLLSVALFVATVRAFRYVSLASLIAAASLPVLAIALRTSPFNSAAASAAALLIIARHHENIRRLRAGTEPRLGHGGDRPGDSAQD
jgi:glycerol-3-phosphate acyltransferase PlsY